MAVRQSVKILPHVAKLVTPRREGGNWRLVLRNYWDQEVILDSEFKLVSTQRVGPGQ